MSKKTEITEFRNRILNLPTKPASDFLANPHNARIHPEAQRKAVKGSLSSLGWIDAVIVNKRTGNLVDGHERVWQALVLGDDTPVPYIEVDIDESEEKKALLIFDYITGMAGYDNDMVADLMQAVESDNADIQALVASMSEDLGIVLPEFLPVDINTQPRLDEKKKSVCPNCGCEF